LCLPVISRDEIKEGYVNTHGLKHDELAANTNGLVSELFFGIVSHYLACDISVVIEAAFQHHVWEPRITKIAELAHVWIILCTVDDSVMARRHLERGLENPDRDFYHGARRVAHHSYLAPALDVPTIQISTDGEYVPGIDEIVRQIQSSLFLEGR